MKIRRGLSPLALSAALLLPAAGCAAEEAPNGDTAQEDAPEETGAPDAGGGDETATGTAGTAIAPEEGPIELVETSFDISIADMPGDEEPLTVTVAAPGTYTFRVTNDSDIPHALEVEGQGVEAATGNIPPGETAMLEVDLPEAGEYDLFCPIGNHRQLGMDGSVVVLEG